MDDRKSAAPRTLQASLNEIDQHLDNLRRCVHWLMNSGISVVAADMRRGRRAPLITVDESPKLNRLLGRSVENVRRRYDGYRTILTWLASAHGCQIQWDETTYGEGR